MRTITKSTLRDVPQVEDDIFRFERNEPAFGTEYELDLDDDLVVCLGDDDIRTTCSDRDAYYVDLDDDADAEDWEYQSLRWH